MARPGGLRVLILAAALALGLVFALVDSARAEDDPVLLAGDGMQITGDQANRLRDIHDRYTGQKSQLQTEIAAKRREVISLLGAEDASPDAVKAVLKRIVELEGRRQQLLVDEYFQVLTVLRPEQKRMYRERLLQRLLQRD